MNIIRSIEAVKTMEQFTFIDVRKEKEYNEGHLPKAVHLDVYQTEDFLMPQATFEKAMQTIGLTPETKIVIYDKGNLRAASKAWYTLYHYGHDHIYILDGGFKAWQEADGQVTTDTVLVTPSDYQVQSTRDVDANIDIIKEEVQKKHQATLIDSRAHERYAGIVELKYPRAGHIPDAVNYEASSALDDNGRMKDKQSLEANFSGIEKNEEVIVSCGSGNSAAVNFVALKEAGYENVSLYAGGFKEWIQDDDNEVEK